MTGSNSRKKQSTYAYSWFMPAPGNNGNGAPQVLPPEPEAITEAEPDVAPPSEPAQVAVSLPRSVKPIEALSLPTHSRVAKRSNFSASRLRSIGLLGWSALSGAGGVMLSLEGSRAILVQAGEIGALWAGLSAVIWFLPQRLVD